MDRIASKQRPLLDHWQSLEHTQYGPWQGRQD